MGIGYIRTSDKPYTVLRRLNLICVAFLTVVNAITVASFLYIDNKVRSNVDYVYVKEHDMILEDFINSHLKATRVETALIIVGTLVIIAGVILNKLEFNITGNILTLVPIPYFVYLFARVSEDENGFFGYSGSYFIRYFISYVFIVIFVSCMLFFAIRQQVRTRKLYKKILDNVYEEYKKKNGDGKEFDVTEEEWDVFLKNFDPRKKKIEL